MTVNPKRNVDCDEVVFEVVVTTFKIIRNVHSFALIFII